MSDDFTDEIDEDVVVEAEAAEYTEEDVSQSRKTEEAEAKVLGNLTNDQIKAAEADVERKSRKKEEIKNKGGIYLTPALPDAGMNVPAFAPVNIRAGFREAPFVQPHDPEIKKERPVFVKVGEENDPEQLKLQLEAFKARLKSLDTDQYLAHLMRDDRDAMFMTPMYFDSETGVAYGLYEIIALKQDKETWKAMKEKGTLVSAFDTKYADHKIGTMDAIHFHKPEAPPSKGDKSTLPVMLKSRGIGVIPKDVRVRMPRINLGYDMVEVVTKSMTPAGSQMMFKGLVFEFDEKTFNILKSTELPKYFNHYRVYGTDMRFYHALKAAIKKTLSVAAELGLMTEEIVKTELKNAESAYRFFTKTSKPGHIYHTLANLYFTYMQVVRMMNNYYIGADSKEGQIERLAKVREVYRKCDSFPIDFLGDLTHRNFDRLRPPIDREYYMDNSTYAVPFNHRRYLYLDSYYPQDNSNYFEFVNVVPTMPQDRIPINLKLYEVNRTADAGPLFNFTHSTIHRGDDLSLGTDCTFTAAVLKYIVSAAENHMLDTAINELVEFFSVCYMKRKIEVYEIVKKIIRNIYVFSSVFQVLSQQVLNAAVKDSPPFGFHPSSMNLKGLSQVYGGMINMVKRMMYISIKRKSCHVIYADNMYVLYVKQGKFYFVSLDGNKMEASHRYITMKLFFDRVYTEFWGGKSVGKPTDYETIKVKIFADYNVKLDFLTKEYNFDSIELADLTTAQKAGVFGVIASFRRDYEANTRLRFPYMIFLREIMPRALSEAKALMEGYQIPISYLPSGGPGTAELNTDLMAQVAVRAESSSFTYNFESEEGVDDSLQKVANSCGVILKREGFCELNFQKDMILETDILGFSIINIKYPKFNFSIMALSYDRLLKACCFKKIAIKDRRSPYINLVLMFYGVNTIILMGGWAYEGLLLSLLTESRILAAEVREITGDLAPSEADFRAVLTTVLNTDDVSILPDTVINDIKNKSMSLALYSLEDVLKLMGVRAGHSFYDNQSFEICRVSYEDIRDYFTRYRDVRRFILPRANFQPNIRNYFEKFHYEEVKDSKLFSFENAHVMKSTYMNLDDPIKGNLILHVKEGEYFETGALIGSIDDGDKKHPILAPNAGRLFNIHSHNLFYEPLPEGVYNFLFSGDRLVKKQSTYALLLMMYFTEVIPYVDGKVRCKYMDSDFDLFKKNFGADHKFESFFKVDLKSKASSHPLFKDEKVIETPYQQGMVSASLLQVDEKLQKSMDILKNSTDQQKRRAFLNIKSEPKGVVASFEPLASSIPEVKSFRTTTVNPKVKTYRFQPMGIHGPKKPFVSDISLDELKKRILSFNGVIYHPQHLKPWYLKDGKINTDPKIMSRLRDFTRYSMVKQLGGDSKQFRTLNKMSVKGEYTYPTKQYSYIGVNTAKGKRPLSVAVDQIGKTLTAWTNYRKDKSGTINLGDEGREKKKGKRRKGHTQRKGDKREMKFSSDKQGLFSFDEAKEKESVEEVIREFSKINASEALEELRDYTEARLAAGEDADDVISDFNNEAQDILNQS